MISNVVICIPARFQSSRLPGKPLLKIAGKPLILWALESATKIKAQQIVVATDDQRIIDVVVSAGHQAIMTANTHQTGTDRIAEVANHFSWSDETIVLNYQGDEPMTPKENMLQLISALKGNSEASIATLYQPLTSYQDLINPNAVKIVTDAMDYALYFSRAAIPYSRTHFELGKLDDRIAYKHHIGLYAYRAGFLKKFSQLKVSDLEMTESLEQLRALSHGYKIIAIQARMKMPHGIDTQEDALRFERELTCPKH